MYTGHKPLSHQNNIASKHSIDQKNPDNVFWHSDIQKNIKRLFSTLIIRNIT